MLDQLTRFSLPDMLQIAVSTVALVIASSIFFQCLTTKYIAVVERYRGLTGEYRGGRPSPPRHGSLHRQIRIYERQIRYLNRAGDCLAAAILVFLVTITAASLSAVFPAAAAFKFVSAGSLFVGLLLVGVGVSLELCENRLAYRAVRSELADFKDMPEGGREPASVA